jgi:membrane protease YdiL (CAAX protease family)
MDTRSFYDEVEYRTLLLATGIGFGAIIAISLWSAIFRLAYYGISGQMTPQADMLLNNLGLVAGTVTIFWVYFRNEDKNPTEFIDFATPKPVYLGVTLVGTAGLFATAVALQQLFELFGIATAEHRIYELATAESGGISPEFILLMVPIAIFVIGPAEELIYRGLVQKSLYSDFSTQQAIGITSLIFALIHFPAYFTSTTTNASVTISTVFILSLILGAVYTYTDNIIIPSLSHGLYNATLFIFLYFEVTGA